MCWPMVAKSAGLWHEQAVQRIAVHPGQMPGVELKAVEPKAGVIKRRCDRHIPGADNADQAGVTATSERLSL